MMTKILRVFAFITVMNLLVTQHMFAIELPRFFGIYILQKGEYIEIPRTDMDSTEYNIQIRKVFGGNNYQDYNIMYTIKREFFIIVDKDTFNKEGFLVIQDEEWSDFRLLRVPHEEKFIDNEKRTHIITNIGYGGIGEGGRKGQAFSLEGLEPGVDPIAYPLKKAKVGENAYIYVPTKPLEQGFYLIDYKKNGKGFYGYNPLQLQEPTEK